MLGEPGHFKVGDRVKVNTQCATITHGPVTLRPGDLAIISGQCPDGQLLLRATATDTIPMPEWELTYLDGSTPILVRMMAVALTAVGYISAEDFTASVTAFREGCHKLAPACQALRATMEKIDAARLDNKTRLDSLQVESSLTDYLHREITDQDRLVRLLDQLLTELAIFATSSAPDQK